jgi:transcriptional regulator with XRE-family HTH domain
VLRGGTDPAVRLGARIRALRHERALTLKELGRAAGLSHPFLSQLERGLARPSVASAERIAAALGVPVASLWHGASSEPVRLRASVWEGGGAWSHGRPTDGAVVLYVLGGNVELAVDGAVHALAQGEALRFDGAGGHRLRSAGRERARAVYVA